MLLSEINTQEIQGRILDAAYEVFTPYSKGTRYDAIEAIYEHDQWWIQFYDVDGEDSYILRQFSVNDAQQNGNFFFEFEEVS